MIIIDTREQAEKTKYITDVFDEYEVPHFRKKLDVGDYMSANNQKMVVERKKSLAELCANFAYRNERNFYAEFERAKEGNIHVVLLIEEPAYSSIEDLKNVTNEVVYSRIADPVIKTKLNRINLPAYLLYQRIKNLVDNYDVEVIFCDKTETGIKIIDILFDAN